jgi:hypothetical protein
MLTDFRTEEVGLGPPVDGGPRSYVTLPVDLLSIEPLGDDASRRVKLTISAFEGGDRPLVERVVTTTWLQDERWVVEVTLRAACIGVVCPTGQTCGDRGTCESTEVIPAPPDGGAGTMNVCSDAGRMDACIGSEGGVGDGSVIGRMDGDVLAREGGIDPGDVGLPAEEPGMVENDEPIRDMMPGIDRTDGGCSPRINPTRANRSGLCENDYLQAWTARGINVGYYPYEVLQTTEQITGDPYDPDAGLPRTQVIQRVVAGSIIALASTPHNYEPSNCSEDTAFCMSTSSSCENDHPLLRPPLTVMRGTLQDYYWGYVVRSAPGTTATRYEGWIFLPALSTRFVGYEPHPCAYGPGDVDFEVDEACGRPLVGCEFNGRRRNCQMANPCNQGGTHCGLCSGDAPRTARRDADASVLTVHQPTAHPCARPLADRPGVRCVGSVGPGNRDNETYVYPYGAYLSWAPESSHKNWLRYGDVVRRYYQSTIAGGGVWDFVEVTASGGNPFVPVTDGSATDRPCPGGHGTCGWIRDEFIH